MRKVYTKLCSRIAAWVTVGHIQILNITIQHKSSFDSFLIRRVLVSFAVIPQSLVLYFYVRNNWKKTQSPLLQPSQSSVREKASQVPSKECQWSFQLRGTLRANERLLRYILWTVDQISNPGITTTNVRSPSVPYKGVFQLSIWFPFSPEELNCFYHFISLHLILRD